MNQQPSSPGSASSPVRVRRPERSQFQLVTQCCDDLVPAEHQVRRVAAVVEKLDLSAFALPIKARQGVAGRDGTDPQLLVALWLYGSICGIGSARELARRCGSEHGSRPFLWLCGGVTVNHHLLSDFRVQHADALDALFKDVIALLASKGLVRVRQISQDGMRVRASAGAGSFRRSQSLEQLKQAATEQMAQLRKQLDDPEYSAGLSAKQKKAKQRAIQGKLKRLDEALAQMPELNRRHAEALERAGNGKSGQKLAEKQPRVSRTDADARVMRMPNGGFNPAFNVQLASDTHSRAIVGVEVTNEGSDNAGLSEPMRKQVQDNTGGTVEQHLIDGGYMRTQDIESAHAEKVELFMPPKPAKSKANRGKELEPKPGDSEGVLAYKARMRESSAKEIYKKRASTSETINADLRTHRGLSQFTVRGLRKAKSVVIWCALAYNLMHFAAALVG